VVTYSRGTDGVWKRTGILTGDGGLFGTALAFRENIAVIASGETLHIFKFETATARWKLLRKFVPGNGRFGGIIAVDYQDLRIVLTVTSRSVNPPTLFVYDIDAIGNILHETQLTARSGSPDDRFGFDVAMTRNVVVVGAPGFASAGATGAAHIFRLRDGQWFQSQMLMAIDGHPGDQFGFAVAIDKGMILVGAPNHQRPDRPSEPSTSEPVAGGAVYVYTPDRGQWLLRTKLRPTPEEHAHYAAFGLQIAMFDTKVAVVATHPREASPPAEEFLGLVFAYDRVGSDLTAYAVARPESGLRLSASGFGSVGVGLNIFGMTLLAGSPLSDCTVSCVGKAISFDLRQTAPAP
jgi:hypothetical protein